MLHKFVSRGPVSVVSSVILSVLFVTGLVSAAPTISTNISTAGTLTVDTTSTLTGLVTTGAGVVSDTDSTDSLGTTAVRWASTFSDDFTGNTITLDGATGVNVLTLPNNVADALSVVSSAGDLMVFDTRTNAKVITTSATSTVNGFATTTIEGIMMPTSRTAAPVVCSATYSGGLIYNSTKRVLCFCNVDASPEWDQATSTVAGTACF